MFSFHGGGGTSSGFMNFENDMRPVLKWELQKHAIYIHLTLVPYLSARTCWNYKRWSKNG